MKYKTGYLFYSNKINVSLFVLSPETVTATQFKELLQMPYGETKYTNYTTTDSGSFQQFPIALHRTGA